MIEVRSLYADGLTYSLATHAGSYLAHHLPIFCLATLGLTEPAYHFAVSINLIFAAFGVISMFCIPLWPALADSRTNKDDRWAKNAYLRVTQIGMTYAVGVALIVALLGPRIFEYWLDAQFRISRAECLFLAAYFLLLVWENIHFTVLVGLGSLRFPPLLYFARCAASLMAIVGLSYFGIPLVAFLGMTVLTLTMTAVPFWITTRQKLALI
jgi:O-antigen/teichoic acid export membrane protein